MKVEVSKKFIKIYNERYFGKQKTKNFIFGRKQSEIDKIETFNVFDYLVAENPFLVKRVRTFNRDKFIGKEITMKIKNKYIEVPQSYKNLHSQQKHMLMLLVSDMYDEQFDCYLYDNPKMAWLMIYVKEKDLDKYGYFKLNDDGKRCGFTFHDKIMEGVAIRNGRTIMNNPFMKQAHLDLMAEALGDKEQLRTSILGFYKNVINDPKVKIKDKIDASKELAKLGGLSDDTIKIEHKHLDTTQTRSILEQLTGSDNAFVKVGKDLDKKMQ
jgi:hypothetical protein